MRIYDNQLSGTSAAETGRTQETQKQGQSESARLGVGGAGGASDRVEFSSALGSLSRVMSAAGASRESRVQALAAQYHSGNYRPDSAAISRAMVRESLTADIKGATR